MKPARPRLLLSTLLGLSLALAGCTAPTEPTPTPQRTVPADARGDVNAQPRDRVRDGGLLRLPLQELPRQWNPRHPDAGDDDRAATAPLAPPHFVLDAAGRAEPNPDFITQATPQHDGHTVVTLRLNPRAVWGDGAPVTAADWVATWSASRDGRPGAALPGHGWEHVEQVAQGAGAHEVVVTYRTVRPDWAEPLVAGPLPASVAGDAAPLSWAEASPGHYAGPFVLAHVDDVQGVVTLERNPRWWGDAPKLERVMFRTVRPEAVAAAFQHNELDVWQPGPSSERLQQTRAAADTTLRGAPGTSGRTLRLDADGLLADEAVRRALLLGLDRSAVARTTLDPATPVPPPWSNPLLLPTQPGYADQARATGLEHDPSQAAKLLDDAGWTLASGRRNKDGQPLRLTYLNRGDDPLAAREFRALTQQWQTLGVTLSAVSTDADVTPASVPVSAFPLAHLPESAVRTAASDELRQRIAVEVDPVRRADQASQLARQVWQSVQELPLHQMPQYVAVRNGVANLGAPGYATPAWEDIGWSS